MNRTLSTQSRTIRLPVHLCEKISKLKKAAKALSAKNGRRPTEKEIADEMKISLDDLRFIVKCSQSIASLDKTIGKEEKTTIAELIEARGESIETQVINNSLKEDINKALDTLPERVANVMRLCYGLNDGEPKSLAEIARLYNLSREAIRQSHNKAMKRLRTVNWRFGLHEYIA